MAGAVPPLVDEEREGTVVWKARARWAEERLRGRRDEVRVRRAMAPAAKREMEEPQLPNMQYGGERERAEIEKLDLLLRFPLWLAWLEGGSIFVVVITLSCRFFRIFLFWF